MGISVSSLCIRQIKTTFDTFSSASHEGVGLCGIQFLLFKVYYFLLSKLSKIGQKWNSTPLRTGVGLYYRIWAPIHNSQWGDQGGREALTDQKIFLQIKIVSSENRSLFDH